MSPDETLAAFRRWKDDGEESAREAIISGNLSMLFRVVSRHHRSFDPPFADMFAEAVAGLIRAVDKFELARGWAFWTFASRDVMKAIGECRRTYSLCPMTSRIIQYRASSPAGEEAYRRFPRISSYGAMGVEERPVRSDCSLLAAVGCEEHAEKVRRMALGSLTPRQRQVIELRYGLGPSGETLSWGDIGERLGCTRQTAASYEQEAKRRLRVALEQERNNLWV
jgi:RNA polymerase primary sigma factor